MKRQLSVLVGTAATALFTTFGAGTAAYAQPAQADPVTVAATCNGNTCSGKDPNATGCSAGARVLADMVVPGYASKEFLVRLSYSPTCNASWTDIQAINQPDCYGGENIWHEAVNNSTGAVTRTARVYDGDACSAYTVMMSRVGRSTRACSTSAWTGGNYCTPWK
ncbi:DUF2690 domain-containing protein [Nonomuraea zeae]|uniref:DUF2690 domain-containing protein n=1 Tax=Nonomuraea zeae TaxID=1642303 RepID=A0A5S4H4E5_9ACTN|nr:DUF2690 domain-containing protein [Nonomuraea zeae]TMR39812.1 DUF2690 domain-containing protein [Nonomuraea zeae]